jgi:hypothetical protein
MVPGHPDGRAEQLPVADAQRRYELRHEHLVARLVLTAGGAALALIGSAMAWTNGLETGTGPVTDGRLGGDGRYTALLAVAVMASAAWYYRTPLNRPARVGAAVAAALLLLAIVDWNTASDDVQSANHDNGLFATASVAPGVWVLLIGAIVAAAAAVWTWRVDR